jgi:hypothetical protein
MTLARCLTTSPCIWTPAKSLRLRKTKAQAILVMTWAFRCLDQVSVSGCVRPSSARGG